MLKKRALRGSYGTAWRSEPCRLKHAAPNCGAIRISSRNRVVAPRRGEMAMRQYRNGAFSVLACIVGLAMAGTVHAQVPRSKVDMPATPGGPELRDPKTGQIWTPLNDGQQSGPPTPAPPAFDPRGQAAYVPGVALQRPGVVPLGCVPS